MNRTMCLIPFLGLCAVGCEWSGATGPTVVPPPSVPAVSTLRPDTWDTRDELSAWVNNGATTGSATVVGDGTDALIEVDVQSVDALLHGPDFSPPAIVDSARVRYRWVGREPNELIFVTMYLRPPTLPASGAVPKLFGSTSYTTFQDEVSGQWVETDFTTHNTNATPGPYAVLFPTVEVRGSNSISPRARIHGVVQIDWIRLNRH